MGIETYVALLKLQTIVSSKVIANYSKSIYSEDLKEKELYHAIAKELKSIDEEIEKLKTT